MPQILQKKVVMDPFSCVYLLKKQFLKCKTQHYFRQKLKIQAEEISFCSEGQI